MLDQYHLIEADSRKYIDEPLILSLNEPLILSLNGVFAPWNLTMK
jgi:hypothetical protein